MAANLGLAADAASARPDQATLDTPFDLEILEGLRPTALEGMDFGSAFCLPASVTSMLQLLAESGAVAQQTRCWLRVVWWLDKPGLRRCPIMQLFLLKFCIIREPCSSDLLSVLKHADDP